MTPSGPRFLPATSDDALVAHLGDWPDCWKRDGWPNLPKSEWVTGKVTKFERV